MDLPVLSYFSKRPVFLAKSTRFPFGSHFPVFPPPERRGRSDEDMDGIDLRRQGQQSPVRGDAVRSAVRSAEHPVLQRHVTMETCRLGKRR